MLLLAAVNDGDDDGDDDDDIRNYNCLYQTICASKNYNIIFHLPVCMTLDC